MELITSKRGALEPQAATLVQAAKWTVIAALLGSILWRPLADHRALLQLPVSAAAIAGCVQAAGIRDYVVLPIFLLIACVYNPFLPVRFSGEIWMVVSSLTAALFFISPEILKPQPKPAAALTVGPRPS